MASLAAKGGRWASVVVALGVAAVVAWRVWPDDDLAAGFARSNGRIEAVDIDISSKVSGRLADVLVSEGDLVEAGQPLAVIDVAVLDAQLREAEAQGRRAAIEVGAAQSRVRQGAAEKAAAEAVVGQRQAQLDAATLRLGRSAKLAPSGAVSRQVHDDNRAAHQEAQAALRAAEAQVAAAEAALATARSGVVGAEAQVEAVAATIDRIKADIADATLRAPRDGRVQYRVAQPGEVVGAGGTVLSLVDLTDVYMTFFLPTESAGKLAVGGEARIVLDAAPQFVIPAEITYVADVAQFTPKTVETADERQKLMFRIKASIPPDLLRQHVRMVKTGLPGVATVRLDPRLPWPEDLQVRVPQ
jgi:HlyD family secretion protein